MAQCEGWELTHIVFGLLTVPVVWWLYIHFVRPSLGSRGARPAAFVIASAVGIVVVALRIVGAVVALLVIASDRTLSFPTIGSLTDYLAVAAMVVFCIPGIAPGLVTRLSGGPDPDIRWRYVLDGFGVLWRKASGDSRAEQTAIEWLGWQASHSGQSARAQGAAAVAAYIHAASAADLAVARAEIAHMLGSVAPFDPVSWVRMRRWASQVSSDG